MSQRYACRKCGRTYSFDEYEESRFCQDCSTYLMLESKVAKILKRIPTPMRNQIVKKSMLPKNYQIRNEQMQFVHEATRALKKNEVFLGSAPCGVGKSLASLLAVLPYIKEKKMIICFRTRNQLHIYLKELRALSTDLSSASFYSKQDMCPLRIKGHLSYVDFFEECRRLKGNCESSTKPYCRFYLKNIRAKRQAEKLALDCAQKILDPRESVGLMARQGFCAYEAIKRILHKVDVFLGTYHYVFDPKIRHTLLKGLGVDLSRVYLIVDEAHNLPIFARELLSDRLTRFVVEGALKETERFNHERLELIRDQLNILIEEIFHRAQLTLKSDELKQINPQEISDLILDMSGISGLEAAELLKKYGEHVREKRLESGSERILSYNYRVGSFMENFLESDGKNYIHLLSKGPRNRIALEVKGFDGREMITPVLQQARGSILMSGFLSPLSVYKDLTLFNPTNAHLREFNSPFPPENRLILIAKDVSSEFKRRNNQMLKRWSDYIEGISDVNQGNMAVFFTSYGLMHKILPVLEIDRKKMVEHQNTKGNDVIRQLSKSSDNLLCGVMGGKLSEGIDYPNNILSCVVAVGLPYATWDIYQKALIHYLEQYFPKNGRVYGYLVPAIRRLVQTCGRVHRSANDKGCIIVLDRRVAHPNVMHQLPKYFQDEIKMTSNQTDCAKQVKGFWDAHSIYTAN